jgi:hypothetical protein
MRFRLPLALLLFLSLLGACDSPAQHRVQMPKTSLTGVDTGGLTLVFSREASNVVVAVDGVLVVEEESARRVHIDGVETGYVNVSIAADGVERATRVWIDSGRATAVPVGNPGTPERMNPVVTTALSVVAFLISRAATDYLF